MRDCHVHIHSVLIKLTLVCTLAALYLSLATEDKTNIYTSLRSKYLNNDNMSKKKCVFSVLNNETQMCLLFIYLFITINNNTSWATHRCAKVFNCNSCCEFKHKQLSFPLIHNQYDSQFKVVQSQFKVEAIWFKSNKKCREKRAIIYFIVNKMLETKKKKKTSAKWKPQLHAMKGNGMLTHNLGKHYTVKLRTGFSASSIHTS